MDANKTDDTNTMHVTPDPDYDHILYFGGVSRSGYEKLSDLLEEKELMGKYVRLFLITTGGDANAAYRIARALRHYYEKVEVMIPSLCKSAGTLIAIAADTLVFGDRGELGPLDVQLSKPDELFENMSGLDLIQSMARLQNQVMSSFRHFLVDIRGGGGLRTKLAAEIATKLAESLVTPIVSKIDPVTLGEHERAMTIGAEYGARLNDMSKSLKSGALDRLLVEYPCHGFVIDRREARELFESVECPIEEVALLMSIIRKRTAKIDIPSDPIVIDIQEWYLSIFQANNPDDPNYDQTANSKPGESLQQPAQEGDGDEQEGANPD